MATSSGTGNYPDVVQANDANDAAVIATGHTVTLTGHITNCNYFTIQSGATLVGGGYSITVDNDSSDWSFFSDGTISAASTTDLIITNPNGVSKLNWNGQGGSIRNLTINNANTIATLEDENQTLLGDLTIEEGTLTTLDTDGSSSRNLTVAGEISIEDGGTLTGNASAIQAANMEIHSGGTYNATSGTTTITATSGGSTSGRAYWSHTGGTMRHNFGTFSVASGAQVEPGGPADAGAGGMDAHSFWNLTSAGSLLPKTQRFVVCNDLETNGDIGYNGNAYWMEIYGTWTHKSGGTNNSDTAHSSRGYVRNMVLQGGELDLEKLNMTVGSFRSIGNGIVKGGTDSG